MDATQAWSRLLTDEEELAGVPWPEALRRYFPVDHVLKGMFELVERLYGIQINELMGFDTGHTDVCFFEVVEKDAVVGRFLLDLSARPNKRAGPWMDVVAVAEIGKARCMRRWPIWRNFARQCRGNLPC